MRTRGLGRIYQPTDKDKKTGARKRAAAWWIQYSHRGKVHREPFGSTSPADAMKHLKRRDKEGGR